MAGVNGSAVPEQERAFFAELLGQFPGAVDDGGSGEVHDQSVAGGEGAAEGGDGAGPGGGDFLAQVSLVGDQGPRLQFADVVATACGDQPRMITDEFGGLDDPRDAPVAIMAMRLPG